MIKYFYNLFFQYDSTDGEGNGGLSSYFNIGYFSSEKKAKEILTQYKEKEGFKNFSVEGFQIQKFGVFFNKEEIQKENQILYELTYEYENIDGDTEWTLFGVYSTKELADKERNKQERKRKYSKYPKGFHIEKWRVNSDLEWEEGFNRDNDIY